MQALPEILIVNVENFMIPPLILLIQRFSRILIQDQREEFAIG